MQLRALAPSSRFNLSESTIGTPCLILTPKRTVHAAGRSRGLGDCEIWTWASRTLDPLANQRPNPSVGRHATGKRRPATPFGRTLDVAVHDRLLIVHARNFLATSVSPDIPRVAALRNQLFLPNVVRTTMRFVVDCYHRAIGDSLTTKTD